MESAIPGDDLPTLGRVRLLDLLPSEGTASDLYKLSVSTLSHSLAQYSAAIIQLSPTDGALLRSCLDSSRLYFLQKPSVPSTPADSREWCKTSGYQSQPQQRQESYDFRPGVTPTESNNIEFPPAGLPDVFALLAKAARDILDAVSYYLNLRSSPFSDILDNVPLRNRETSSSVLSVCYQLRNSTAQNDSQLDMFADHEHEVDKSLITLVKADKAGLHIRDFQGRWILVDGDLSPQEVIVYPGLALYRATAGYVSSACHYTDNDKMFGRYSVVFKLMPKSTTNLNCSEMRAAGHGVEPQFQVPVSVDDFMITSAEQLLDNNNLQTFNSPAPQDGCMKLMVRKRKKIISRCRTLPPSKRLRLEAQRVLKERVQDIADKKGIKLRFCTLKDCENHIQLIDSPCSSVRKEIGWPAGVPFVHPHDLNNKAKIGFLETYEPGWSTTNDTEVNHIERGQQTNT